MQTFFFSNLVPARQCTCTIHTCLKQCPIIQPCTCAPMYLSKDAVALGYLSAALYRQDCVLAWSTRPVCCPVLALLCTFLEQGSCLLPCTGTPVHLPGAVALSANLYWHSCVLAWSSGHVCSPVPALLRNCLEQWPCLQPCTGTPVDLPGALALSADLYWHACVLAWSSGPVCRPVLARLCTCLEQWPCLQTCMPSNSTQFLL
jgi:hypothetical protein